MHPQFSIEEISRQLINYECTLTELGNYLPCYIHINSTKDFSLLETDSKIETYLDMSREEINAGGFELVRQLVHPDDLEIAVTANEDYLKHHMSQSNVSFFQRVHFPRFEQEQLYFTRGKLLDDNRILNLSVPVHNLELFNHKAMDFFDHAAFVKANLHKYNRLTKHEHLICFYLCEGDSIQEAAGRLNVSKHTIKNHKTNIYKKMEVSNFFEFYNFCVKFKLNRHDG